MNQNFHNAVYYFEDCLRNTLDEFAPLQTKCFYNNPNHLPVEWKDEEYSVESNKRRKLERFWKNTLLSLVS